jgi:hypothetical protein
MDRAMYFLGPKGIMHYSYSSFVGSDLNMDYKRVLYLLQA